MGTGNLFKADGTLRGSSGGESLPTSGTEALLDEHETAAILGLSVKTLRRWRWAKRGIAWVKLSGGAVRYEPAALRSYIEAARCNPAETPR